MFGRGLELFRLMVVEGDRLVGVLSLKDLLSFFSMRLELGEA